MSKIPRVALLLDIHRTTGREVLRGIARWMRVHGPWELQIEPLVPGAAKAMARWQGDGLITRGIDDKSAATLAKMKTHKVYLARQPFRICTGRSAWLNICGPISDVTVEAQMAFEHLRGLGLRRFAFVNYFGTWSRRREMAFTSAVDAAGLSSKVYQPLPETEWTQDRARLTRWLGTLQCPVGIWAANDERAEQVAEACRSAGLSVPDDVALMGIGNDLVLCEVCNPPLTSIAMDAEKIGYEAASLLSLAMAGQSVPTDPLVVPPVRIETRQSTDITAIEDQDVATALRMIRRTGGVLNITDIAAELSVSRRVMERRFREVLGRPPSKEIERVRLERAKRFLAESDLKISAIASRCGYANGRRLAEVFRRCTGLTPGEYRNEQQHADPHRDK